MGIKNLHRVLEKYAPGCYQTRHLSYYSYKKVAIDISLYLYKYKAIHGDRWLESFLALIVCLRKWDVHCIFIYDGKAPIEKLEEQQRRRESRVKQSDKIRQLEDEMAEYAATGKIGELMCEIQKKEGIVSLFRKRETVNMAVIRSKLEMMKSQQISITLEDLDLSRALFDVLSIPYVIAPAEAECYASQLCLNGKVDAVMSEDTDVLAYGTPLFLTKVDINRGTVVEIMHSEIIVEMGMTPACFTDLCIMCSCDYNSNLPLIGMEKSVQLLTEHGSIEEVIKVLQTRDPLRYSEEACEVLKYERCREMFKRVEVDVYLPYCGIPEWNVLSEFLFRHSIRYEIAILKRHLSPRELVFEEKNE